MSNKQKVTYKRVKSNELEFVINCKIGTDSVTE